MKKMCALYDSDEQYAYRFMGYVNDKKLMPYDVIMFTRKELLEEYLKEGRLEILLLSDNTGITDFKGENVRRVIRLSEEENTFNNTIFKYQSADMVVKEILRRCSDEVKEDMASDSITAYTDVIGVYSPVGRCYKTALSLALSICTSRKGRVLYINLEEFCGIQELINDSQGNLSDLVYYFRHSRDRLKAQMEAVISSLYGFDFIPVCSSAEDFEEIMPEEWISFIKYIARNGGYDIIILDIGNVVHEAWKLISICRTVYMPRVADETGIHKINLFNIYMKNIGRQELLDKIIMTDIPSDEELAEGNVMEHLEWSTVGECARRLVYG